MVWQNTFENNKRYLAGEPGTEIITLTGAPPASTTVASTETPRETVAGEATETPRQTSSATDVYGIPTTGPAQERLLGPIRTGAGETKSQVDALREAFLGAAGPQRSWESIGGEKTVSEAVSGPSTSLGKDLVKASYTGPTGLSASDWANLQQSLSTLYGRSQALGTSGGLQTYLQQAIPGLTRGEARYEAQQYAKSPDWTTQLPLVQQQMQEAKDYAEQQSKWAQEYAKQRAISESDIARQARETLLSKQQEILNPIDLRVTEKEAQNKAIWEAYEKLLNSGTLPGYDIAPQLKDILESENIQKANEAQAKWNEIMGQYSDISNIPLMEPGHSKRFKEYLYLPEDWEKANQITPEQLQRSRERQLELERWFSPRTEGKEAWDLLGLSKPENWQDWIGEGIYSKYKPLYFGANDVSGDINVPTWEASQNLAPLAIAPNMMTPTRSNIATESEKTWLKNIDDMLDQANSIDYDTNPWQAAQIAFDVEKAIADQEMSLDEWDTAPTDIDKKWREAIAQARRKYKKAKRKQRWGQVITALSWTSPLPALTGSTATALTAKWRNEPGRLEKEKIAKPENKS